MRLPARQLRDFGKRRPLGTSHQIDHVRFLAKGRQRGAEAVLLNPFSASASVLKVDPSWDLTPSRQRTPKVKAPSRTTPGFVFRRLPDTIVRWISFGREGGRAGKQGRSIYFFTVYPFVNPSSIFQFVIM
jgi:hypothetical protein